MRFPSTIPPRRGAVAKLSPAYNRLLQIENILLFLPIFSSPAISIALPDRVCGDKSSFSSAATVGSTWFSPGRFLFVDDRRHDRQRERTGGRRSAIAFSWEEKALVDAVRKRTRRTRTDHWAQVGYDCFRSDHLAIADGVPEPRRRDPAPGLRRNTPVRYNWVSTQSECQSIKSTSIIGSLRMEWILSNRNRESLAGSSGRPREWIFEKWISFICLYFSWRVPIHLKLNHEGWKIQNTPNLPIHPF